ncbi:MAG: alpha/beta hydrolase [Hydrogenophaga sp.]
MKIVLVHGMFSSNPCWQRLEGLLRDRNIEVRRVALHPQGVAKAGRDFEDVTASVRAQIADLVDQPFVLVGHSLGALVVEKLLPAFAQARAVLVNPSPGWGTFGPVAPLWMAARRGRFWRGLVHPNRNESRALLFQGMPAPDEEAAWALVEPESGELVRQVFWFFDLFAATTRLPGSPERDITVLTGSLDPLATPAVCRRLVSRYGLGSRLEVVPANGHMLMLQDAGARCLADRIAAIRETSEWESIAASPSSALTEIVH